MRYSLGLRLAGEGGARGGRVCATEYAVQHGDHLIHVIPGEGVVDSLCLPAGLDEAVATQPREMLRQRRLAESGPPLEVADALLAVHELAENEQAMAVAHRLQQLGRRTDGVLEVPYIHDC